MQRMIIRAAALAAVVACAAPASAGIYTDDLSRCLVKSASTQDRDAFMRWMFSAMSVSPTVRSMASVAPQQRDEINRNAATLLQRLILQDCRSETITALKNEGPAAFETGFRTLGEVAARGLVSDPSVAAEMSSLDKYVDKSQWEALAKESGLPRPSNKPGS